MDWAISSSTTSTDKAKHEGKLSEQQEALFKEAFRLFDDDDDGALSQKQAQCLLQAAGVHNSDVADDGLAEEGGLTLDHMRSLVHQHHHRQEATGERYYVLMTLAEAEALRAAMHT
eukprot:CAMPEP_0197855600 /NCGR_PEP_ID=MMETSP1438-20131217/26938_1 /TAXON_ID=1461541 /ORGANISM="Pterosperma sp., Strain CCMP1384" /LENGTH=115 /DNA_ID=CAMNT_0043470777 /DNA_START=17 /DNA_END=360 /DNA_ORIENTATION=-